MKSNIFEKILNQVSLDSRVKNGMFNIEEDAHMDVLREYFINKGIEESAVIEFCNTVIEGKYPERQAYNAKGILVTFPTPEYKAAALKRGTHFEEDPTRQAQNVFKTSTPAAVKKQPSEPAAGEKKTSLPLSQASTTPPATDSPAAPDASAAPEVPAAPEATVVAPQQSTTPTEPPKEPTELPAVPVKSSEEKEKEKTVIMNMLKGDDYKLEEVVRWIISNQPALVESIKKP